MTETEITNHPDFTIVKARWKSVALAAGRTEAEAEERGHGMAYHFVARRIARKTYLGQRRVGPPPMATST